MNLGINCRVFSSADAGLSHKLFSCNITRRIKILVLIQIENDAVNIIITSLYNMVKRCKLLYTKVAVQYTRSPQTGTLSLTHSVSDIPPPDYIRSMRNNEKDRIPSNYAAHNKNVSRCNVQCNNTPIRRKTEIISLTLVQFFK
jgi:hypothetical protein